MENTGGYDTVGEEEEPTAPVIFAHLITFVKQALQKWDDGYTL